MPKNSLNIGPLIRKFYMSMNLTQKDFAEEIGYSRSYISEIITGHRAVTEDFKIKFKHQFKFEVEKLVTKNEPKHARNSKSHGSTKELSKSDYTGEHKELVDKLLEVMHGENIQNKKMIKSNLEIMTMKGNSIYSLDFKEWRDAGKPERRKVARM
ncbi:MAG: helix-turn-helix transcriptional regulator [Candidatus Brocadiales bacterium]|nr:helix-turn-helix transcriptional regulator [Candidatus Brocadiales bacterium]